jgi:hypothetical protein
VFWKVVSMVTAAKWAALPFVVVRQFGSGPARGLRGPRGRGGGREGDRIRGVPQSQKNTVGCHAGQNSV